MGKTKRPSIVARLDQDKLDRLDKLSQQTRIPRSVLIREAIDDLLMKYKLQTIKDNMREKGKPKRI